MQGINLYIKKRFDPRPIVDDPGTWVFNDGRLLISQNKPYPHYAVNHWENGSCIYIVEGHFFEWTEYQKKIEEFAVKYFTSVAKNNQIADFFSDTDAEFVIIIYDKVSGSLLLFNDVLGRLPVYICDSGDAVIISRNISFIETFQELSPDYSAFSEFLTFGFNIGTKTLYHNLKRLRGGTVIEVRQNKVEQKEYHKFDYGEMIEDKVNISGLIKELKLLFVESIINRSRFSDLNVIALSGGLDSRAVAGAFRHSGLSYMLASFCDHEGNASLDVSTAKKVSEVYGKQLTIFNLAAPGVNDYEDFFNLKSGLLGLDMAFVLNFYKSVSRLSLQPALFTGDGGDKVFPDLLPKMFISTPWKTSCYAVRANAKMDPSLAGRILREEKSHIFHDVHNLMESYPEEDWGMKYIHFIMDNRVANWLTEGEDRNRSFLNSFTPFYNIKIYKKLMSVSPDLKRNYRLYHSFLRSICPETYRIPNANWGFTTARTKKISLAFLKQQIKHTSVGASINWLFHKQKDYFSGMPDIVKTIFAGMIDSNSVRESFDIDFIKKTKHLNFEQFMNVCTIIKIISKHN